MAINTPQSKILCSVIVLLMAISIVSAYEFDNIKSSYDSVEKQITIKNAFGLGSDIAKIKLDTPLHNIIYGEGYQRVAEITFDNYDDYQNWQQGINFYYKDNMQSKTSGYFDYKYLTYKDVEKDKTELVCEKIEETKMVNQTINEKCTMKVIGKEIIQEEEWLPIEKVDMLPKGNITIGIYYSDVKIDEVIEWIPTFYGVEIPEWADFVGATIYTSWTNTPDDYISFSSGYVIGQEFTTYITDFTLVGVTLPLFDSAGACNGDFSVKITNMTGNHNYGPIIASNTTVNTGLLPHTSNPLDAYWYNITGLSAYINNNTVYYIQTSGGTGNTCRWAIDGTGGAYNGGGSNISYSGGWSDTRDFQFIVWGTSGTTPITKVLTATQSYPVNFANITTQTIPIGCNFTGSVTNNISSVMVKIYNSSNYLSYTDTETADNGVSYNKTWTTTALPDNMYNWSCFGYGNGGINASTTNRTFTIDSLVPIVNITYPIAFNYSTNVSELNYTATDLHLQSCWFSVNATNTTIPCGTNASSLRSNEGYNTWSVYANDSFGNSNLTTIVTFFKDTIKPLIEYGIGTPKDNATIDSTAIFVNTTWTEINFASIKFSLFGTMSGSVTYNTPVYAHNFTGLIDGVYTYNVTICDTSGNCNYTDSRNVSLDTIHPIIDIIYPLATNYNTNVSELNYTIVHPSGTMSACWYSLNGGTNINVNCGENLTGLTSIEGSNTWCINGNDTAGGDNIGNDCHTFFKDTVNPKISIVYPLNGNNYTQVVNQLNLSVSDTNLQSCWYSIDNSATNVSFNCNSNISGLVGNEGNNNWTIWANDSFGNINSSTATFNQDSIIPSLLIYHPNGIYNYGFFGLNFSLNYSITDTNLQSCWYDYNGTTNITIPCTDNSSLILTIKKNLTMYANDTYGNINSLMGIWNFQVFENNVIYDTPVYETSSNTFIVNFTGINLVGASGILNYNGTNYVSISNCAGNTCSLKNVLDVPSLNNGVPENKSFYWSINTYNGTASVNEKSSTNLQLLMPLNLSSCPSGNISINFTGYDEQNRTRFTNIQFDGTFYYWTGEGGIKKELNITVNASEVHLCFTPNVTYYLDAIIAYAPNPSTGYTVRNYFYQAKPFNWNQQNVGLYSLLSASATGFVLKVQDENLQPAKEMLVEVQKAYPGTNEIITMFLSRTNILGTTYGDLEANSALYQFLVTNQSSTLLYVTPPNKVVPQTAPYTLLFQLGGLYASPFVNIENITDIVWTLFYNKTTSNVVLTYADTSGKMSAAQLVVTANNLSGTTYPIICDSSLYNLSAGVIYCNITGNGGYTATAYFYRSPARFMDQIVFIVQNMTTALGGYGFLLGFFILIICMFSFKYNEIAGIIMTNVGIWAIQMLGLIDFGYVFCSSILLISIVIISVIER